MPGILHARNELGAPGVTRCGVLLTAQFVTMGRHVWRHGILPEDLSYTPRASYAPIPM
ncbi:hypothetical protein [Streptomyces oceani]|uniref:hypothetical protein n=1 Tax=Streptomyces oceani TaxID=1075402 RepID=UPI00147C84B1|nr:hypothetical protein [Streptomyces oceani]